MKITNFVALREAKILEESESRSRIAIDIISPGESANGRIYEAKMLSEAYHLYEGAKVYLNHPTKQESIQRPERDIRELVGYLESVKPDMAAELVILKHQDVIMPLIKESIATGRDLIGLSHNVLADVSTAKGKGGRRKERVEAIRAVKSVDIVTEAAAGGKFKTILEGGSSMDYENVKELQEAYPELMDTFKKDVVEEVRESLREELKGQAYGGKDKIVEAQRKMETQFKSLEEAITKLTDENVKLTDALESKERDGIITGLLTESNLPEIAQARVREMVEAKDHESHEDLIAATEAAIKSEKEYLSTITESGRVKGLGGSKQTSTEPAALTEARKELDAAFGVLEDEKDGDK